VPVKGGTHLKIFFKNGFQRRDLARRRWTVTPCTNATGKNYEDKGNYFIHNA
jgi:hypothetical protein